MDAEGKNDRCSPLPLTVFVIPKSAMQSAPPRWQPRWPLGHRCVVVIAQRSPSPFRQQKDSANQSRVSSWRISFGALRCLVYVARQTARLTIPEPGFQSPQPRRSLLCNPSKHSLGCNKACPQPCSLGSLLVTIAKQTALEMSSPCGRD
jgi:hypothetical protein